MKRQQEAHEQIVANNAIEDIYFTEDENELFRLMHEARLPAKIQTELMKKHIEITLGVKVP